MANIYTKEITVKILSRGRKYFQVAYPDKDNKFNLVINELSSDFEVGGTYTVLCTFDVQKSQFGQKTTATPVTTEAIVAAEKAADLKSIHYWLERVEGHAPSGYLYTKGCDKLEELNVREYPQLQGRLNDTIILARSTARLNDINKYLGYVEEKAESGYLYSKGIDVLKELKISEFPELQGRLDSAIALAREIDRPQEIKRWLGYVEEKAQNGYLYEKGVSKLEELGIEEFPQYQKRLDSAIAMIEEVKQQKQKAEEQKEKCRIEEQYGTGTIKVETNKKLGDLNSVIAHKDNQYTIADRKSEDWWEDDDGISHQGYPGRDCMFSWTKYVYYLRPATSKELQQESIRLDRHKAQKEAFKQLEKLVSGDAVVRPENAGYPNGKRIVLRDGHFQANQFLIVDIELAHLWYLSYNGRDGDDWSWNNVAGSHVGYYIPLTSEIEAKLSELCSTLEI